MTAPRSFDDRLDAFLEEGQRDLPDRTFDAVRRDIHTTRQRVVIGPWKEPTMSTITRLAIAAAIGTAVVLAWASWPGRNEIAAPTPTPQSVPAFLPLDAGGRYTFAWGDAMGADGEAGPDVTITIPSTGWASYAQLAADKNYGTGSSEAGASFVLGKIVYRYEDPCTHQAALTPTPGPGVDDIIEALSGQPGLRTGTPEDVTIDGYSGKSLELTVVTDITACVDGEFYPWNDKFVQGNNEVLRVYALDVDGFRLTFFARIPERTTPTDRAELEAIIDSIDIEP